MTSNRDFTQVALSCKTDSEVGSQENSNLKKHLNVASYASPPKQILSVCGATCITVLTGQTGFKKMRANLSLIEANVSACKQTDVRWLIRSRTPLRGEESVT